MDGLNFLYLGLGAMAFAVAFGIVVAVILAVTREIGL